MDKEEAIKILQNEIEKLYKVNADDCYVWLTSISSYIKTFFGETSNEYVFINGFHFYFAENDLQRATVEKFPRLKLFINNCIEAIKNRGLYKPPKHNFLYSIDNRWLIPIIVAACGGFYGIGFAMGKSASDVQNIELRRENKELKSSLNAVRPTLVVPDNKSNSNTKGNDTQNIKDHNQKSDSIH